uniref:Putative galactokinase n=1 Tax=Ixodes ricinus TaxID=34613 RepID=A0A131Y3H5_IXORI
MGDSSLSGFPPEVPLTTALNDEDTKRRITSLQTSFVRTFGIEPEFYVRAPGRVNLIGEHIDYCGYAVLPMAVQQDILVACRRNEAVMLHLSNAEPRYPSFSVPMDALKIDDTEPCWYHYYMCGVRGVFECRLASNELGTSVPGMDVLVHGSVPPSAGLSSSSALVCAAALATLRASGMTMPKLKLASMCATSERFIGTQGGGMDQAIAFLAEQGTAKLIEFNPLKTTSVALPKGATFVVANSCVEMNKAATSHYNVRVVECQLAALVIAKAHNLECKKRLRLGDVQASLGVPLHEMSSVAKLALHPASYTRAELCNLLDLDQDQFETSFLTRNTKHLQEFKLYQRAVHVYEEASRVWRFKEVCDQNANPDSFEGSLAMLGQLMNESHASCRDLYECSHPDLDRLVDASLQAGALGSRLTGAGWGGCAISLVPSEKVDDFLDRVKSAYYDNLDTSKEAALFVTRPGSGAMVFVP